MSLLPVINHLIQQNPEIQMQLAEFEGSVVWLRAAGFSVLGCVSNVGFLETTDQAADTEIIFENSAIQKVLQGLKPGVGDVRLEGDIEKGLALLPLLGAIRYYANADISRLFGDAAAGAITQRAFQVADMFKQLGRNLMGQFGDYAHEPDAPVITRAEFEMWAQEVDKLRDDIARLNARLDKLEPY